MSDEIKKIDEISETQNAPEIKKEKKKLSKKAKKIIIIVVSVIVFLLVAAVVAGVCALNSYCKTKDYTVVATADDVTLVAHRGMRSVAPENTTAEEAQERTIQMLNLYADFCEDFLAIPVVRGQKTDKEKFAGAEATYTIESLMHDGKALQSGTSHNFGDGFAKAFGIQYSDKDNQLKYVHQTSWGMTTRMIGAIIMVHGDNEGLVLPPNVAPTQVVIVPIRQQQEGVLEKAREVEEVLSNFRVKVDDSDKSPGWKFSESEMRGIPVRVELGPKDIEAGQAVLVRRDTHEKITVALSEIAEKVDELLKTIQHDMYERAKAHRDAHTYDAHNMEEMKDIADNKPGFIRAMWCGCQECEDKLKEQVGVTSRCMPFKQEKLAETCVCCGKPATKMVYWGKAY